MTNKERGQQLARRYAALKEEDLTPEHRAFLKSVSDWNGCMALMGGAIVLIICLTVFYLSGSLVFQLGRFLGF